MSLLRDLKEFRKNEKISMHIPGHKSGRGLGASFVRNAARIDLTELDGTDNLQNPCGILKAAQDRCAKIFGAGETHFLTGGSTLGLLAAVMGCAPRGAKLLVDRTCHKSVISAVVLGGIEPIFITPELDADKGLYLGISADAVRCALTEHPDVCGAVITSPTYYGICSDIGGISEALHKLGKFLIVDEAHGAHFVFSKRLPQTALSLGADVCVQSAHKTLPALGQCSYLHIAEGALVDTRKLVRTLRMLGSTSPSYLLMTSLDEAARYMSFRGKLRIGKLISAIEQLKAEVSAETVLTFADAEFVGRDQDCTRLTVDFSAAEISGRFAEKLLIEEFGIYPEMSDERYVVLIPTVANTAREIKKLSRALCSIGGRRFKAEPPQNNMPLPEIDLAYLPEEAAGMKFETLPAEQCVGRISAAIVSACPPGAAVLVPGQRIDESGVRFIKQSGTAAEIDVIA